MYTWILETLFQKLKDEKLQTKQLYKRSDIWNLLNHWGKSV